MEKRNIGVLLVAVAVFALFIVLAFVTGVRDYINDSIFMLVLSVVLYFIYDKIYLKAWIYLSIVGAFALHNLGIFGFYNVSPIFLQWDHLTHLVGEFAAGVLVYNYAYESGFFKVRNKFFVTCFVVLAALGIGVFVEYVEFIGYFVVGDGLGIFGHGEGDIVTEFISNEWFNTMLDLIWNLIGVVLGVVFYKFFLKKEG